MKVALSRRREAEAGITRPSVLITSGRVGRYEADVKITVTHLVGTGPRLNSCSKRWAALYQADPLFPLAVIRAVRAYPRA